MALNYRNVQLCYLRERRMPSLHLKFPHLTLLMRREKDVSVRQAMADSFLAIASTKWGRAAMWKINGPEILKKGWVMGPRS